MVIRGEAVGTEGTVVAAGGVTDVWFASQILSAEVFFPWASD